MDGWRLLGKATVTVIAAVFVYVAQKFFETVAPPEGVLSIYRAVIFTLAGFPLFYLIWREPKQRTAAPAARETGGE
jgi:hypothetical protein